MRKKNLLLTVCIPFIVLALALSGCDRHKDTGKVDSPPGSSQAKGIIRISGAWALYPMVVKWAEEYQKANPDIRIDISAGGAGKGVADTLAGLVDMGMVSRELTPEETKRGILPVPVVKDAVFLTVSSRNPVLSTLLKERGLTRKTLVDLWINGKAMTWGEITGTGSKEKVQVYTRSDSCGAAETWAHFLGNRKQEDLKGVAVYGDPGLAEAVRNDSLGIGYNNLGYAFDGKTGLPLEGIQVVPIDTNGNGRIDPSEDVTTKDKAMKAVASGAYPSPPARDLYLVAKERFTGPSLHFVKWILSEGQRYVAEAGYTRIREDQTKDARRTIGD